jgi:hypothetical protein
VYVAGNPGRTTASVRKLQRDLGAMSLADPYASGGQSTPIVVALADPVQERILHMVNADPSRTPTFTLFGNPDFFFTASSTNPSCGANPCVAPGFAWNHGDIQDEIANTWVGFVGPGIAGHGSDDKTWTDHANVRPTMLAVLGLKDDYVHDGRVLTEALTAKSVPAALAQSPGASNLARLYERLNASFGQFAIDTLAVSTKALESSDDAKYASLEDSLTKLSARRDSVAGKIKTALGRASFGGKRINPVQVKKWLAAGNKLLADAAALKGSA